MNFLGFESLTGLLIFSAIFLFSISFHEAAHAYVAYQLGDPTAKINGRITLNPLKHLDLLGALAFFIIGVGWAKPVPINPNNFQNRRKGIMLSSLAGPVSNFFLALCGGLLFAIAINFSWLLLVAIANGIIFINTLLMIFNLIPIPPLDGAGVLGYFIPRRYREQWNNFEENGSMVLLIIIGIQFFFNIPIFYWIIFVPANYIMYFIKLISGIF